MARFRMFHFRTFLRSRFRFILITAFLGLLAYKAELIPLQDSWNVRKIRTSYDTSFTTRPRVQEETIKVKKSAEVRQLAITKLRIRQEVNKSSTQPLERQQERKVSHPACIFPKLELYDPKIMKFVRKFPRLICKTDPDWLVIKDGKFVITETAYKKHPNIRCDAFPIVKLTDFNVTELAPIKNVTNLTEITTDFYRVQCDSTDGQTYKNYIAGIHSNKEVHKRARAKPARGLDLDVIMLGLDSTSRLAWQRHLPKTRDYFVKVLNGTEMEGYNILGDGTPAAIMPILLGHREEELHEARKKYKKAKQVDDFPWIWNTFSSAGYVTSWAEDDAALGTFQHRLVGFKNQPTDHYFRYFVVAAEPNYGKFPPHCQGSRPRHSVVLDYMNEMFGMYPDRRKWMFSFQGQLSHRDNNLLSKMDDDLLEHLQRMHRQKSLDNAIFILLADHGGRFSKVRSTAQGKLEERLPYLGIRFPEWFHKKYPQIIQNIQTNSKRLTTPFDVHETLHEIVNFTGAGIADISKRGVSMFKEIPVERDCQVAHIDPHWCSCLDWHKVDIRNDTVKQVVATVIDTFNNYTSKYRHLCSLLSLSKIISAASLKVKDAVLKFKHTNDGGRGRFGTMTDTTNHTKILYQVSLLTDPGGGSFEATVTHDLLTRKFILDKRDISRTNKYGNDPWCVEKQDAFLRPYCYCNKH